MIPRLYESTETSFSTFGICPLGEAQPFRIENISGDMGGIVTIEAVHISYQLNWIMATRQTTTSGTAQTVLRDVGLMTVSPFTLY